MQIKEWTLGDVQKRLESEDKYIREWAEEYSRTNFPQTYAGYAIAQLDAGTKIKRYEFSSFFRYNKEYGLQHLETLLKAFDRCDHNHAELARILADLRVERFPELLRDQFNASRVSDMDPDQRCEYAELLASYDCEISEDILWNLYDKAMESGLEDYYCAMLAGEFFKIVSPQSMVNIFLPELLSLVETFNNDFFKSILSSVNRSAFDDFACYRKSDEPAVNVVEQCFEYADDSFERLKADPRFDTICLALDEKQAYQKIAALIHSLCLELCNERNIDVQSIRNAWGDRSVSVPETLNMIKSLSVLEFFKYYETSDSYICEIIPVYALCVYTSLALYPDELMKSRVEDLSLDAVCSIITQSPVQLSGAVLDRAASFGTDILPFASGYIKQEGSKWYLQANSTQVIERISKEHPKACAEFVPQLIEEMHEDCSDLYAEACSRIFRNLFSYCKDAIFEAAGTKQDSCRTLYTYEVFTDCAGCEDIDKVYELYDLEREMHENSLYALKRLANHEILNTVPLSTFDAELLDAIVTTAKVNNIQSTELSEAESRLVEINEERDKAGRERMELLSNLGWGLPTTTTTTTTTTKTKKKSPPKVVTGLKTSGSEVLKKKQLKKKKKKKKRR